MGYVLTDEAVSDLSEIYDYTLAAHGEVQAEEYLTGLDESFLLLIQQPMLGRLRSEIRNDLRSKTYEHHTIFYRVLPKFIRIVRVLHSRRDFPRYFL